MDLIGLKNKLNFEPRTILDIGANAGWWYGKAKEAWPDSFIWMIEGNPHCEKQLKEIDENVTIALLSDTEKDIEFYTLKEDLTTTGASYFKENTNIYEDKNNVLVEKLKTKRLDDLFEEDTVFDLIKLDTQGSEIDIMRGGINLLKKSQLVIVEADMGQISYNKGAPRKEDVVKFMKENNFEHIGIVDFLMFEHPDGRTERIQEDLVFINKEYV
tara:strand:+ start:547 stop:1188 length:642 start_codon:yes stop_codon:yes gene_type:complete